MLTPFAASLRTTIRLGDGMMRHSVATALSVVLLAGCNADALNVPNFNQAAVSTTPDIAFVQSLATGIFIQSRANLPALVSDAGILGRESLNYTPTDGRNTSAYLGAAQLDNSGFASGGWNGRFTNMRNAANFLAIVDGAAFLTDAQKNAARGFAKTFRFASRNRPRHEQGPSVRLSRFGVQVCDESHERGGNKSGGGWFSISIRIARWIFPV
jgi:hypothetical protein